MTRFTNDTPLTDNDPSCTAGPWRQREQYVKVWDAPLASADTWAGRQAPATKQHRFRFHNVSCSQCGEDFGPGDHGFSQCADHADVAYNWPGRLSERHNGRVTPPKPKAPAREAQRDDGVTPLAEHIVLDCLRALKVISLSPYALELTDMISRGYLDTPEHIVRMRRIDALLKISSEESES